MKKGIPWMAVAMAGVYTLATTGCSTLKPSPERRAQMERTPWEKIAANETSHDNGDKGASLIVGLLQMFVH